MEDGKSREQLIAEIDDLRRQLSALSLGGAEATSSRRGEMPNAPSFAYFNPAPVLRFDLNGTILTINPAAVELIGSVAMEGASLFDIFPAMGSLNVRETIFGDGQKCQLHTDGEIRHCGGGSPSSVLKSQRHRG